MHYYGRRFDGAVSEERRVLELAPHLPLARDILGRALIAAGRPKEAVGVVEGQSQSGNPEMLATLSVAYARSGERQRAAGYIAQLEARQPLPTGALVRWYVATGDHTRALELLDRLVSENSRSMPLSVIDPALDPLRSLPRFQDVRRRLKAQSGRPKTADGRRGNTPHLSQRTA